MKKPIQVVLSGGAGSRLWPLSRKSKTKQFIPIFDNKSLFEIALSNNKLLSDHVIVVGSKDHYEQTKTLLNKTDVGSFQIIVEACAKNTAAAIAFAALSVKPDELLLVTPSDQIIENLEAYKTAVNQAIQWAEADYLVTFGMKPHKPETGYGYIQSVQNEVVSFHEKPTLSKANSFLAAGNYFWNSGMFCFKAHTFLEELGQHRPDILEACQKVMKIKNGDFLDLESSQIIPAESIDYAVMEKSKRIKMVEGNFYWSDLGSFESLYEYFKTKNQYVVGTNLVITDSLEVEIKGLENMLVIQSKENLLIMPLSESQEVKKIYERLLAEHSTRVL
jgi:mannose-1-phosphate guanylyltransferase